MKSSTIQILLSTVLAVLISSPAMAKGKIRTPEIKLIQAKHQLQHHRLRIEVELKHFTKGQHQVNTYDAILGHLLDTREVSKQASFEISDFSGHTPPCRVSVEAGGVIVEKDVSASPESCSQYSLVLQGVVRDSAIPFATVTVTVGGITYTTVADANGEFVIEIATIDVDDLVVIESSGTNPNDETQTVDMTSIAGSFSKLVEDSDGDGVVDGSENPNINNTPFTTALFVLVVEANGSMPTTVEELDATQTQIDGTELLQIAAVIKAIVDGGLDVPIDPATGEQYGSILEFISDAEVDGDGSTAIDNFVESYPAAVEAAAEELVSDPSITPAFVLADIPERYYSIATAAKGFLARSGNMLRFDLGGSNTGSFGGIVGGGGGGPISRAFNWSVSGGQLKLDFRSDPFSNATTLYQPEGFLVCRDTDADVAAITGCGCADITTRLDELGGAGIYGNNETRSIDFTRLAVGGATEFVRKYVNTVLSFEISDALTCEEFEIGSDESQLRNEGLIASIPFIAAELELRTMAIPLYFDLGVEGYNDWNNGAVWLTWDAPRRVKMDLVTFESTGIGCTGDWKSASAFFADQPIAGSSSFDLCWRVVGASDGRTIDSEIVSREGDLEFDYQDGWIQVVRKLEQLGPENGLFHDFWNTSTTPKKRFGTYDVAVLVDADLLFTEAMMINDPDEHWNAMINGWHPSQYAKDGGGNLVHLRPFGWQFFASGVLYNGSPGSLEQHEGWDFLDSDLTLDNSYTLPQGAMRLDRYSGWSRFWIPMATSNPTDPLYLGSQPGRNALHVLEFEFGRAWGTNTNFSPKDGLGPRINKVEIVSGSLVP